MNGLQRYALPARNLAAAATHLGKCSQTRPITASSHRQCLPTSTRALWTSTGPTRCKIETYSVLLQILKQTTKAYGVKTQSLVPPVQALRNLYQKAAFRSFSSSSLFSAKSKTPQRPTQRRPDIQTSQPVVRRSTPPEWKANYESSRLEFRAAAFRAGLVPNQWVLWLLGGINLVVYVLWQYAQHAVERFKDPTSMIKMYQNFTCSFPNLAAGRYWTILSSCFSHQDFGHFAINMVSIFFLAPSVLTLLGPTGFSLLYVGAGVGAAVFSLSWRKYVNPWINKNAWDEQRQKFEMRGAAHGASGSIFGVITTFALVNPRQTFLLFFVIPAPAWLMVPGIFAWDLYSAWDRPNSGTDSAAHVGGAICGLLFWRFKLRGFRL